MLKLLVGKPFVLMLVLAGFAGVRICENSAQPAGTCRRSSKERVRQFGHV